MPEKPVFVTLEQSMCEKYKAMAKLDVAFLTEDEFQVDSQIQMEVQFEVKVNKENNRLRIQNYVKLLLEMALEGQVDVWILVEMNAEFMMLMKVR